MRMVLGDADELMDGQKNPVVHLTKMGVGLSLATLPIFA